jgi:hypothetical protein
MLSMTFSFKSETKDLSSIFFFHSKPLIKHLIAFSFLKSLYLLISRYQCPFFYFIGMFLNDFPFLCSLKLQEKLLLVFYIPVSFQDLSIQDFPFSFIFFACWVFLCYGLNNISWIPFTSNLTFLGFTTTFLSLVDTSQRPSFSSYSNTCPQCGV